MTTFAEQLFDERRALWLSEDKLINTVLAICGVGKTDFSSWFFNDVTYDEYDYSFELKSVKPGFTFTPEQLQKLWDLGFDCCWLNYTDKYEMYYSRGLCAGSLKDPSRNFVSEDSTKAYLSSH